MKELRINFFEEFYTLSLLISRCKQIPFSSTVYIACKSFDTFVSLQGTIKKEASHIELGFWPVLPKSYWVSPFSYTSELTNLYNILSEYKGKEKIKVLLDLELPLLHPKLFFKNISTFNRNKKIIENMLKLQNTHNIQFFSAEYPMPFSFIQWFGDLLGIHYSHKQFTYTTIVMQYNTPVGRISKKLFMFKTIAQVKKHAYNEIALGIIAPGVFNETNFLSPETLKNDLEKIEREKITTVTIFSLAGFMGEYRKVIQEVMKNKTQR